MQCLYILVFSKAVNQILAAAGPVRKQSLKKASLLSRKGSGRSSSVIKPSRTWTSSDDTEAARSSAAVVHARHATYDDALPLQRHESLPQPILESAQTSSNIADTSTVPLLPGEQIGTTSNLHQKWTKRNVRAAGEEPATQGGGEIATEREIENAEGSTGFLQYPLSGISLPCLLLVKDVLQASKAISVFSISCVEFHTMFKCCVHETTHHV